MSFLYPQKRARSTLQVERARERERVKKRNRPRTLAAKVPPHFIAVDGEGIAVANGTPQPYVLLGASTGDYIEDYDEGLSSTACFNFLINLSRKYPKAVLVVFGGVYDMTQFLRDVPPDNCRELAETSETIARLSSRNYYRLRMMPGKLMMITRSSIDPVLRRTRAVKNSATLYDVFGFFQCSFVKALDQFDIGTAEVRERILNMKLARDTFAAKEQDAIRAYCIEECELLVALMDKLAASIIGADMSLPRSWHGAGAIADSLMRDNNMADALAGNPPPAVERAYYGGRIETTGAGVLSPPVYDYDINSAYPAALKHLPPMRGVWRRVHEYSPDYPHAVYVAAWDVRAHPIAAFLSPFPVRYKGGIWWPSTGRGYYLAVEIEQARRIFGDTIRVGGGWVFEPEQPDARPWAWIEEAYKRRRILKRIDAQNGTLTNVPIKLGLNALYGKTAQGALWRKGDNGPELSQPKWRHVYVAAYATAYTRAAILATASQHPESVISIATDSVVSRVPLELPLGDELGDWGSEEYNVESIVVHPGFIVPSVTGSMKLRVRGGMSADVSYDDLVTAWKVDTLAAKVEGTRRTFLGLRLAAGRGQVGARGAWLESPRFIRFATDRRIPRGDMTPDGWLELQPPIGAGHTPNKRSARIKEPTGREALIRWGVADIVAHSAAEGM